MKSLSKIALAAAGLLALASIAPTRAQTISITEIDPSGSGNSTYKADWFELTNTGTSAVDITGWKMDDNSDSFSTAVALKGVTNIAAGQSVVFIEDSSSSPTADATLEAAFESAWFGSNVPTGFTIGAYNGSGVGLSTSGDGVNIFNASGTQVTGVNFDNSAPQGVTYDNSVAKVGDDSTISTLSASGSHGAFTTTSGEVGSPGFVPEPTTWALLLSSFVLLAGFLKRRGHASL